MEHPTINDLPNEVLEMIFDHLEAGDLNDASLVCRRWSALAFSERQMDRVKLVPTFPWDKDLLQGNRKYRHLKLKDTEKCSTFVDELLPMFDISSLRIRDNCLSHSSLVSIFLNAPNLQHLSIRFEPKPMSNFYGSLPVMRKLEHLEIMYARKRAVPWHTIAPSLQRLKMFCESEDQLKQWRFFSVQLKQVYVTCSKSNVLNRFCEMTFPLLEELSIKSELSVNRYKHDFFRRHEFFRRNTSLRRLRLDGFQLSKTLVQDITNNSKKLTSLEIIGLDNEYGSNCELGALESLGQLSELKHLRLKNLDTRIFLGCEALTSLQSFSFDLESCDFEDVGLHERLLVLLKDLFKIAPQLSCLEFGSVLTMTESVQFICNHFTKLTRLQLRYGLSRDCLSRIDRLPHLSYLELTFMNANRYYISIIPENKVRCLTLHLGEIYDEEYLLQLPEVFPQLDRLNFVLFYKGLRESTVDRLRQSFRRCTIKIYVTVFDRYFEQKGCRIWHKSDMMSVWEKEWVWKK
ncbi:uncharacterized protein LOC128277384 [Anopheles cruzii]|uniref:uncharacterized protein LOC128277384 n=1 Tax=Anopheles cruzii TaxID=68878 RepID=UPI0022EC32C4|nr:uncharacterized protein LOC128277384 [Anopheles cruzii]